MIRNLRKSSFNHFRNPLRFFSTVFQDHKVIMKLSKILKIQYHAHNDEINPNVMVRLIDEKTGNFLGIFTGEKAL